MNKVGIMQISYESQGLCENSKTGIGWYSYNLTKSIFTVYSSNKYEFLIFDFLNRNNSRLRIEDLFCKNVHIPIKVCSSIPYSIYSKYLELFALIPYNSIINSKADIYHFFNYIIPRNIKGKVVNTVYDMVYKLHPETMEKGNLQKLHKNLQRSCRDSDVILTISQNSKQEISDFMNVTPNKIEIAYPAVDRDIFKPEKNTDLVQMKYKIPGEYLLYLGTLEPRKNITSLIKAFKIISEKNKDIFLVIAGKKGWMYEEIFKLVDDLHLNGKVIFTGYVEDKDIPFLYSSAVAFIFPSLYEGFGMPPLEAMACGTPVIVSNTSSLPEVVGDAGIFVDPLNIENIAFEMDRLLNDNSLQQEYSKRGLQRSKIFSWEDSAKKVIDVYQSLA